MLMDSSAGDLVEVPIDGAFRNDDSCVAFANLAVLQKG